MFTGHEALRLLTLAWCYQLHLCGSIKKRPTVHECTQGSRQQGQIGQSSLAQGEEGPRIGLSLLCMHCEEGPLRWLCPGYDQSCQWPYMTVPYAATTSRIRDLEKIYAVAAWFLWPINKFTLIQSACYCKWFLGVWMWVVIMILLYFFKSLYFGFAKCQWLQKENVL